MSTKEEIFDYVMNSPENTNPAVLRSLLDGIEGSKNEPFFIELSGSDEEPVLTASFSDIIAAINSGRVVYLKLNDFSDSYDLSFSNTYIGLTRVYLGEDYSYVQFETYISNESYHCNYVFTINNENHASCDAYMYEGRL